MIGDCLSREVTPEKLYLRRRELLKKKATLFSATSTRVGTGALKLDTIIAS